MKCFRNQNLLINKFKVIFNQESIKKGYNKGKKRVVNILKNKLENNLNQSYNKLLGTKYFNQKQLQESFCMILNEYLRNYKFEGKFEILSKFIVSKINNIFEFGNQIGNTEFITEIAKKDTLINNLKNDLENLNLKIKDLMAINEQNKIKV